MTSLAPLLADFDPLSPAHLQDPHAAVQALVAQTPVVYHEGRDTYYALSYDAVRRVLLEDGTYSSVSVKTMPVRAGLRDRIPAEHERVGQLIQGTSVANMDAPAH